MIMIAAMIFALLGPPSAASEPDVSDPRAVFPALHWTEEKGLCRECSIYVRRNSEEVKYLEFNAKTALTTDIESMKSPDLIRRYEEKLESAGFHMNDVPIPGTPFTLFGAQADGPCGESTGFVKVDRKEARTLIISRSVVPCVGVEPDDPPPSPGPAIWTYKVYVSGKIPLSEILKGLPSKAIIHSKVE
jgi:hypothetical protein